MKTTSAAPRTQDAAPLETGLLEYARASAAQAASESSGRRWTAYTSVAGSALALAAGADATVHLTTDSPVSIALGTTLSNTAQIDVDGGGADLRLIGGGWSNGTSTKSVRASIIGTNGAQIGAAALFARTVAASNSVSLSQPFVASQKLRVFDAWFTESDGNASGAFGVPNNGYGTGVVGLKLSSGLLGWVRLRVDRGNFFPTALTALEWAYEDQAESSIHVPARASVGEIPEPSTWLAGLATGAAGILAYRQRRKAAAAAAAAPQS